MAGPNTSGGTDGDDAPPLLGRTIVVTRPREQSKELAALIETAGGLPLFFPVLEILDAEDLRPFKAIIAGLDTFDIAIFISPTAVRKAMNLILAQRALPASLRVAAIGKGSARELKHFGVARVISPTERFDSEHLLALPDFQSVDGRRIVIFRGDGGRETLGDTLTSRGARVEYAECYRRARPHADAGELLRPWARGELDAITVTSGEGLHNLYDMVGKLGQQWLKNTPIFVFHERIAEKAARLGLQQVVVTGPGDDGLYRGLIAWFKSSGAATARDGHE
ncbi:MAG: uroporphyrinogen-III synthase [Betaproteobacteria bacterium]|nr:uroporphyrinogen-III synthase [Betaproteobacteria bacterium]